MLPRLLRTPFYPYLIAIFPVLSLLSSNLNELQPKDAFRTISFVLLGTILLLLGLRLLLKDMAKAAIIASITILLILSYGHLYHFLRAELSGGLQFIRHRYLSIALGVGYLAILVGVIRTQRDLQSTTLLLNLLSIGLLIYPVFQISSITISSWNDNHAISGQMKTDCHLSPSRSEPFPDIYYIVLDGYARQDVLLETYEHDNGPFLESLEELGFFIADASQSNYAHTLISLSSSLNMMYHDLHDRPITRDEKIQYRIPSVGNNVIRRELECLGYVSVSLDSGRAWSNWGNADRFITVQETGVEKLLIDKVNEFESMLFYNSIGLIALDTSILFSENLRNTINHPSYAHQENILFTFSQLEREVPMLVSPKIVYAHLITPHRPYFFGPDGELMDPTGPFTLRDNSEGETTYSEVVGYRNQVVGINRIILQMVSSIIENSQSQPIIVIHSDHGTGNTIKDHMAILTAIYLPGIDENKLYETITPVNIFRVIFNEKFNGEYEILEDRSFYSHWKTRFDFTEIPNPSIDQ